MNERIRELADQVLPNEKEFHQGDPKDWGYFFSGDELEKFAELVVKAEPVAWSGYDLDGMVEAFSRVIEAHHTSKHPFHDPIDTDARTALRILRGITPAMKAYTAPPQRKPLTEEDEPVLVVEKEPDYWSGGHFYQGSKPHIDPTKVWSLPIGTKLYTAPPQRTMVPLTEEEINRIDVCIDESTPLKEGKSLFARAIENASWEKNHGQT